jgi:hypothetical protein
VTASSARRAAGRHGCGAGWPPPMWKNEAKKLLIKKILVPKILQHFAKY